MQEVQALREQEREAQQLVQRAKEARDATMREALVKARAEIENLRQEEAAKLKQLQDKIDAEVAEQKTRVEAETKKSIEDFQSDINAKLAEVSKLLTNAVLKVELPPKE